jgi:hypothetical protein
MLCLTEPVQMRQACEWSQRVATRILLCGETRQRGETEAIEDIGLLIAENRKMYDIAPPISMPPVCECRRMIHAPRPLL